MSDHDIPDRRQSALEAIAGAILDSLRVGMPPDQLKERWRESCDYTAACNGIDSATSEEAYRMTCRMIDAASGRTPRPSLRLAGV